MKVKTSISIIQNSNWFLIAGMGLVMTYFFSAGGRGSSNVFFLWVGVIIIASFFLRNSLLKLFLARSKYPGAFYSVAEKLGLNEKVEIELTQELLDDIYNPSFSQEEFINENNLHTSYSGIRNAEIARYFFMASFAVIGVYVFPYLDTTVHPGVWILSSGLFNYGMYRFTKKFILSKEESHLVFGREGLEYGNFQVKWNHIVDWEVPGSNSIYSNKNVVVSYYNDENNLESFTIKIPEVNASLVEILLMFYHGKSTWSKQSILAPI